MKNLTTIPRPARVRNRGQITIPRDLREEMDLGEESTVNFFRVGKVLLITPRRSQRVALARKMGKEMKRQGVSLEDLLADLKAQRKRYR